MIEKNFVEYAQKFYKCHRTNNIKQANVYAKKMHLLQETIKNSANYEAILDELIISDDKIVRIWSCGQCIDLNYRKKNALDILNLLTLDDDKIISRDAKMLIFVKTKM